MVFYALLLMSRGLCFSEGHSGGCCPLGARKGLQSLSHKETRPAPTILGALEPAGFLTGRAAQALWSYLPPQAMTGTRLPTPEA